MKKFLLPALAATLLLAATAGQNNLYAIAVANHYTGFPEINLSAEIKLVPPLMEPALQILKPAS